MLLELRQCEDQSRSAELRETFEGLEWLARDALRSLREIVYDLEGVDQLTTQVVPSLRAYLEHVAGRALGLSITLEVSDDWPEAVATDLGRAVFSIVAQAVTNVRLHSGATQAVVRLKVEGTEAVVEVEDDGVGLRLAQVNSSGAVGLRSMRQRARLAGGALRVLEGAEGGGLIKARLPLEESA